VLQIGKVRAARARYYLSTTRAGGGDEEGLIEPDGRFVGALGDELDISGTVVAPDGLRALFAGVDPKTGTILDTRHDRVAIAAYDCMFASPKSVSLLHALAADDVVQAVRTAHEHAVDGALGYLEKNASYVRREGSLEKSDGFVAAQFIHRTSRASDPHLHSHVLVANLAAGKDGHWSAIDARPMFANVGVAGSLYRAQLRNEITRSLGFEWKLRVQGFSDLIGISPRALRAFSKRSAEIKDELDRSGRLGERAGRIAADRTRPAKETSTPYAILTERWREQAFEVGISRSGLDGLARRHTLGRALLAQPPDLASEVTRSAERFERPFDRRELIRATCAGLAEGAAAAEVEAAVDSFVSSGALVRSGGTSVFLRSGATRRFPSGMVEERFANRLTADLSLRLAVALERAPELDDRSAVAGLRTITVSGTSGYQRLRELAIEADARGRMVVGLSPNLVASSHLEAITGIEPTLWNETARIRNGAVVVITDPLRCPLRRTVELFADAEARGMTVVVIDDAKLRLQRDQGHFLTADPERRQTSVERISTLGVRVMLAPDLASAVGEVRRLADEASAGGRRVLTVTADTRLFEDHGGGVVRPSMLAGALRDAPRSDLIVLGSSRLLGSARNRIDDQQRTHVAVAPSRMAENLSSYALCVAEPQPVARVLGRLPAARHERAVWRSRAESIARETDGSRTGRIPSRVREARTGLGLEHSQALS